MVCTKTVSIQFVHYKNKNCIKAEIATYPHTLNSNILWGETLLARIPLTSKVCILPAPINQIKIKMNRIFQIIETMDGQEAAHKAREELEKAIIENKETYRSEIFISQNPIYMGYDFMRWYAPKTVTLQFTYTKETNDITTQITTYSKPVDNDLQKLNQTLDTIPLDSEIWIVRAPAKKEIKTNYLKNTAKTGLILSVIGYFFYELTQ